MGIGRCMAEWKMRVVGYELWAEDLGRCYFLKEEKPAVGYES